MFTAPPARSRYALLVVLLVPLFFGRWIPHGSLTALEGDSSIFLYIGQQFNHGLTPYVDVWDLKPPMIYWLDAFSLWFTPCSARSAVCLACLFVVAFFVIAWATLRRRVGAFPTIFALLLGMNCLPSIMLNPNLTEVFALPFQALSFLLLAEESESGARKYYPALQGLIASVLLQLRPNNTAVIGLYLLAAGYEHVQGRSVRRLLGSLAMFLFAFAAGNLIILSPFVVRGALPQYWDAVFRFAERYSTVRPGIMHLYALLVGLLKMSSFGASIVAGAAVAVVVAARPSWRNVQDRFALLTLALLGMEIAAVAVSGRAFEHYFILTLLPVTCLAGVFVKKCGDAIGSRQFAVASFCGASAILLAGSIADSARAIGEAMVKFQDGHADLVRYVRERTAPGDRVFLWNGSADVLVRLDRRPATRFFHSAAMLDVRAYRDQATEALRSVELRPPRFIMEYPTTSGSIPGIFQMRSCADGREKISADYGTLRDAAIGPARDPWDSPDLQKLKQQLREQYKLVYSDGSGAGVFELR